jgi:hypothetical protein
MSVPPIGPVAAALRAEVLAAAEAELAKALGAVAEAATETSAPQARPPPATAALDLARATAAGRQGSLAPLFADLAQAAASPDLPAPIRAAIAQVLALRLPLDGPLTTETVMRAVAQSGLFLEAHLAETADPPPDLKAALLRLGAALTAARGGEATPQPPPKAPPPPVRGAALAAQPATSATLPKDAEAPTIAARLQGEVEQAVARQTLHQLASAPDGPGATWLFELPLATPQGTSVAQFEVQRDRHAGGGEFVPGWRLRFSIDVEPLGPVHVHLGLAGERASVTVWAERPQALEALRREAPALAQALPAEVVIHGGAPHAPAPPPPGRFLDRTS